MLLLIFYYFKVFVLWSSLRKNYRLEHKGRKLEKKEEEKNNGGNVDGGLYFENGVDVF